MKYLKWITSESFEVEKPSIDLINTQFNNYVWIDNINTLKGKSKVVFSEDGIKEVLVVIEDIKTHIPIFRKPLKLKVIKNEN